MRPLSEFQRRALELYAGGARQEEVAAQLGTTKRSVVSALAQARLKTGGRNSLEAAAKLEGLTPSL